MELCVTACEKFSNNNEVLPWTQVAPCAFGDPLGESIAQSPQPVPENPARACPRSIHSLGEASETRGWCCLWALSRWHAQPQRGLGTPPPLLLVSGGLLNRIPFPLAPWRREARPGIHSCIHSSIQKRCHTPSRPVTALRAGDTASRPGHGNAIHQSGGEGEGSGRHGSRWGGGPWLTRAGLWAREAQVQIPPPALPSSVTLGNVTISHL